MPRESAQSWDLENVLEHMFLGELMSESWFARGTPIEVLRAEVDNAGYDLVLECRGVVRHVQLKGGRGKIKVNCRLAEKPAGCIVWIQRQPSANTRTPTLGYRFSGGKPTERFSMDGLKVAKKTTYGRGSETRRERPNIREVPGRRFSEPLGISELFDHLFPGN